MGKVFRIISFGAGVQSTCVALRSVSGDLPKPDAVIFADTGWEPKTVYRTLEEVRPILDAAEVPLLVATKGSNIRADMVDKMEGGRTEAGRKRFAPMPFYTRNIDGRIGMTRRQCTREYKIEAIERTIRREILGLLPGARVPKGVKVEQVIGISTDEASRMSPNPKKWIENVWPLCDMPVRGLPLYSRSMCETWLREFYPALSVSKSACIGCPFHSDSFWRQMREERPEEWADVVDFDRRIRSMAALDSPVYVHRSGVPLESADLSTAADHGQTDFFDNECEGMCGV